MSQIFITDKRPHTNLSGNQKWKSKNIYCWLFKRINHICLLASHFLNKRHIKTHKHLVWHAPGCHEMLSRGVPRKPGNLPISSLGNAQRSRRIIKAGLVGDLCTVVTNRSQTVGEFFWGCLSQQLSSRRCMLCFFSVSFVFCLCYMSTLANILFGWFIYLSPLPLAFFRLREAKDRIRRRMLSH